MPRPTAPPICTPPTQAEAEYEGFPTYYAWLRAQYDGKRRLLMDGLAAAGACARTRVRGGRFVVWPCRQAAKSAGAGILNAALCAPPSVACSET